MKLLKAYDLTVKAGLFSVSDIIFLKYTSINYK